MFPGEGKHFLGKSEPTRPLIDKHRTHDIEVPVTHERSRGTTEPPSYADQSKRYSLPIQIDIDHLHDPYYTIPLPGRGRLNVDFSVVVFCRVTDPAVLQNTWT